MKLRLLVVAWVLTGAGIAAEVGGGARSDLSGDSAAAILGLVRSEPAPLPEGDFDRDGLPDALEDELARFYAPVVILDRDDWVRPASIPWLLAREAKVVAPAGALLASAIPGTDPPARRPFSVRTRQGSADPRDWTTYVHVYPRADGGLNLQYWFFYPYSDGPLMFDHESDWEHLTVRLDSEGSPLGAYLSRHEDNNPGVYRLWARIRREGHHPVVLSARGTHATYADQADLAWWESAGACGDLADCEHPVWKTWAAGGLANVGERSIPQLMRAALSYTGRWGAVGVLPGTSAPHGPVQQRGFCHAGFNACRGPYLPEDEPAQVTVAP